MGFFSDLAKSLLFGDNNYADEVVTEFNLRSDTGSSLIRAIDASVEASTDQLSIIKAQILSLVCTG